MGLMTNEEFCQAVWGIVIKNFRHKYFFLVSDFRDRFQIPSALIFCSVDREGPGRIYLPVLRCREFNSLSLYIYFKCTFRCSHPI